MKTILHVDMDAFYASVEQLDHPEYRGKPVIVGSDPKGGKGRGVVAACSYEARAFGVHSALPIGQAWQRCPHGIYVRPRGARYAEVSGEVFAILGRYSDLLEPLSIDEAFLDLSGTERLFGCAASAARSIKADVRKELGLVASVGVAPNKFVAKVASDLDKPDGLVVVPEEGVRAFLRPLPISRLWGVGPKTAERLARLGARTIGDIASRRAEDLRAALGEVGEHLWRLARGIDERPVVPESEPKSLGAEVTFDEDHDDPELVRRTLLGLCERVGARLRRRGLQASGLTLKYRDETFQTWSRAAVLPRPTDLGEDLHRAVLALLERVPTRGRKVRLLGVSATRLAPASEAGGTQLHLFERDTSKRRRQLASTVDHIRARFGSAAIRKAALLRDREEE